MQICGRGPRGAVHGGGAAVHPGEDGRDRPRGRRDRRRGAGQHGRHAGALQDRARPLQPLRAARDCRRGAAAPLLLPLCCCQLPLRARSVFELAVAVMGTRAAAYQR